jgi:tetratricopeptide (TPR) repeat protein
VQKDIMRARAYLIAEQPMRITGENAEELRYESSFLLEADRARSPVYLTVLGNIAARSAQPDEAKAKFEAALKADPSSLLAHAANAIFLLGVKDGADRAKAEFAEVLKAKPDHMVALVGLAQLALAENKADQAVEKLEAALKVSDDFTARMLLGNAKVRLGKNDEAAVHFQRASQLDPRNAEAWRSLGQSLLGAGKPDEAEHALRSAAQIQQDAQTVVALGFALERQKKSDQALGMFNAVLQQNAGDPMAMFGAASALEDLGKKADAINVYRKLLGMQVQQNQPGAQVMVTLQQQAQQHLAVLEGKTPPQPLMPGAAGIVQPPVGAPIAPR